MQNLWQKKPKLNYNENIFDIVQFGSSVIEKRDANDLDVAVIFKKTSMKEQLLEAQKIKKQLKEYCEIPIHISSFELESFFDKSNFSREGILFYGISLLSGDFFAKKFGLTPRLQISYSLISLKKKDKVRFHYQLQGKGGKYGLLRKYGGKLLEPGLIAISPTHEEIFVQAVKKITSEFKVQRVFVIERD